MMNKLNKPNWISVGSYVENTDDDFPDLIVDTENSEEAELIANEISRRLNVFADMKRRGLIS